MSFRALVKARSAHWMYSSSETASSRDFGICGDHVVDVDLIFWNCWNDLRAEAWQKSRALNWEFGNCFLSQPNHCSRGSSDERNGSQSKWSGLEIQAIAMHPDNSCKLAWVWCASQSRLFGMPKFRPLSVATSSPRSSRRNAHKLFSRRSWLPSTGSHGWKRQVLT